MAKFGKTPYLKHRKQFLFPLVFFIPKYFFGKLQQDTKIENTQNYKSWRLNNITEWSYANSVYSS